MKIKQIKELEVGDIIYLNYQSRSGYTLGLDECVVVEVYPRSNCMGSMKYGCSQAIKVYNKDANGFRTDENEQHFVSFENMPVLVKD